jgi:hypothetical protein
MKKQITNSNQIKINTNKVATIQKVWSPEFNPYMRSANVESAGNFKQIPANKERVKKAGRAVIVIERPNANTLRLPIRTKSDMIYAEKAARYLKPKSEKVEEVIKVKKLKFTFKKVRKVMRMNGAGTFKMVWKVTNNINDVVKYFELRKQAEFWAKIAKKRNKF